MLTEQNGLLLMRPQCTDNAWAAYGDHLLRNQLKLHAKPQRQLAAPTVSNSHKLAEHLRPMLSAQATPRTESILS